MYDVRCKMYDVEKNGAGLTDIVGVLKRACPFKIVIENPASQQYGKTMYDVRCMMSEVKRRM